LDDWAEVDMVVSSLADDIVDSMNPRDTDGDGVAEDRGPLGNSGEELEPFLPEEERDRRARSAKHARWAINVSPKDGEKEILHKKKKRKKSRIRRGKMNS
jgi:hypothetical protein